MSFFGFGWGGSRDWEILKEAPLFVPSGFTVSGLLYVKLMLLRHQLGTVKRPLNKETQPPIQELKIRRQLAVSLWQAAQKIQETAGKEARQLQRDSLETLNQSLRYQKIIRYPHELWQDEQTSKDSGEPVPVYFDWGSILLSMKETPPRHLSPRHPAETRMRLSFVRVSFEAQDKPFIFRRQQPGANHPLPPLPRYTAVLDMGGYPLNPLCLTTTTETGSSSSSSSWRVSVGGRGVLATWGPNVAADAIVMRRHPGTEKLQVRSLNPKP